MLIDAQAVRAAAISLLRLPMPCFFFMRLKTCVEVHGDAYDRPVSVRELNEFRSAVG
jgi:hypothetical protein